MGLLICDIHGDQGFVKVHKKSMPYLGLDVKTENWVCFKLDFEEIPISFVHVHNENLLDIGDLDGTDDFFHLVDHDASAVCIRCFESHFGNSWSNLRATIKSRNLSL